MFDCYLFANFGQTNVRNGQVQKALALKKLFSRKFGERFHPLDVSRHPRHLLRVFTCFSPANLFCVSLGRNGIRIFALAYLVVRLLRGRTASPRLLYFVVGGWIGELAASSRLVMTFLKTVDVTFVETPGLASELRSLGVTAQVFPNFRSKLYLQPKGRSGAVVRLCFCSRITRDKGALLAIALASRLATQNIAVTLDFYGPIDPPFHSEFSERLNDFIRYRGTYESDEEAIDIMRGYDFLVLPTSYPGECMPGVVIEAFCAATPVVTSDWRYMSEVVDHGHNGLVIGLQNFSHDAAELLVGALAEETYLQYSRNSLLTAQHKYSEKAAEAILEGIDGMVS